MPTQNIQQALAAETLLCDGATGTELQKLGLAPGQCGELWNIEHPNRVSQVHLQYAQAGANLLTTNTFGGTRFALAKHNLEKRQSEINKAAASIARAVAGSKHWVLGDIGPCGALLEPYGDVQPSELLEDFTAQSAALLDGGADAILVETMSDPAEAVLGVKAAQNAGAKTIIATYAFQKTPTGFRTMMGTAVDEAMQAVLEVGAHVVGSNCGTSLGMKDYEELADCLLNAAGKTPVILQPNGGTPVMVDGKITYRESVSEMAILGASLRKKGIRIVGGCCGTNPEHIQALRNVLDAR